LIKIKASQLSHTTNPGNLDPQPENDTEQVTSAPHQRTVPWRIIVVGIVALLLAVFIGTQVLGVLYVIVFPPVPPLPGDVTLVSHANTDYGVDTWLYDSRQKPCDVLTYYMNSGGECRLTPSECGDTKDKSLVADDPSAAGQNIARCVGVSNVSIFAMRWMAIIATGPSSDLPTEFRIEREVYWTGEVPPIPQQEQP
jgi:hypothetical protein